MTTPVLGVVVTFSIGISLVDGLKPVISCFVFLAVWLLFRRELWCIN